MYYNLLQSYCNSITEVITLFYDLLQSYCNSIAASLDWAAAFDRQDPTLAIQKFIQLGVRPSLIPLLISYLSDRKMTVKFNGEVSEILSLIGGGPQGTLLGQLEYIVNSNDNADIVSEENRFKYIDDLSILQMVLLSGLLTEYNCLEHVPSDVRVDQVFLPAESYATQDHLNFISNWTDENLMKLNPSKCDYMVFSRAQSDFATRLSVKNTTMDKVSVSKILGVWIEDSLGWGKNTTAICVKAYSRVSMLTKLKYIGVKVEDLLDIYVLFIRSVVEYCSVAFHSSLTIEQTNDLERIQKVCLKIILGDNFVDYSAALEMTGLETLYLRRETRVLNFSLKCLKHPVNKNLFPLNENNLLDNRHRELFKVNFARTDSYKDSAIPYCQRKLNDFFAKTS